LFTFGNIFNDFVVQPIFNLLIAIYALLPGHNFGLAIIIFTIVIRLLMWPLVKKQLHQAKAMRKLQPEIKRIKAETKGNRQRESMLLMELYKERNISPFGSIGVLIVQLIILIGLYQGLIRVIDNPQAILDGAYMFIAGLPGLQALAADISKFDNTLFGVIDLSRAAISSQGLYLPALLLVTGSAVAQYFQTAQLMPQTKDARSLRSILKEAGEGKQADPTEIQAAMSKSFKYLIPALVFITTIYFAAALSLYWMVGGIVAYIQQSRILKRDEEEMEAIADQPDKPVKPGNGTRIIIDGEVIKDTITKPGDKPAKAVAKTTKKPAKKASTSKRRKR